MVEVEPEVDPVVEPVVDEDVPSVVDEESEVVLVPSEVDPEEVDPVEFDPVELAESDSPLSLSLSLLEPVLAVPVDAVVEVLEVDEEPSLLDAESEAETAMSSPQARSEVPAKSRGRTM